MKPCEISCPKCGSDDICREFHAKGDYLDQPYGKDYEKKYRGFVKRELFENPKATKDFLAHHCRDCGYEWATKPLTKQEAIS